MKIIINALLLSPSPTGLGVYIDKLLSNLKLKEYEKILLLNGKYETHFNDMYSNYSKKYFYYSGKFSYIKRNYYIKKYYKENDNKDNLFFSPTAHGGVLNNARQIIVIHDLMPLLFPFGRLHQYIYHILFLKSILFNANLIITVSENTKKDLIKHYKILSNRIRVVYNGSPNIIKSKLMVEEKSKEYIKNKYGIENYILMVGIQYRYKNLHSVIKSANQISQPIDFVIVGKGSQTYEKYLYGLVHKLNLLNKVHFLGYVNNDDLYKIYQSCLFFIYPSLYEGFGLPVLEAMFFNKLVLCSNSSSLPEVVNNAAIQFNPKDIDEISKAINYALKLDSATKNNLLVLGENNLRKFDWSQTTRDIESIINEVARGG